MKNILYILVFATLPAIGQNTEAVRAYLGDWKFRNVAPPAGPVMFDFSTTSLPRKADGKTKYKDLLSQGGYFQDGAKYGTFVGVRITEGGTLVPVQKYELAKDETGTLTKADVGSALPVRSIELDSQSIADRIESGKGMLAKTGSEIAKVARPIWDLCMWVFYGVLPFLLGLALVMYFISGLAADEVLTTFRGFVIAGNSLRFTHSWSSLILYWDLVAICVVLIINSIVFMYEVTHSCWVFLPLFLLVRFMRRRASRVIPNISVAGSSGDTYTKELHSGR